MSFRYILHELLATTPGAQAAIFVDFEGETVELVCDRDLSDHDLRIVGAYQSVAFARLRELAERIEVGKPERYKIDFQTARILCFDLKDGYYLVLLIENRSNEGVAWRHLSRCRDRLLAEM